MHRIDLLLKIIPIFRRQQTVLSMMRKFFDAKSLIKLIRFSLVYKTARQLDGSSVSAKIHRYNGGGYALDLLNDYSTARQQIKELKQLGWVDRGTRAIFLDFTLYNGNVNLFCHVQLIVEFPATGGAVTSRYFSSVKLIRVSFISSEIFIIEYPFVVRLINGLFCLSL